MLKKIVIIGPESAGKSTLCTQLARHYNTLCCEEYAREYLTNIKRSYTYNDLLHIAQGQLRLEDETAKKLEEKAKGNDVAQPRLPLPLIIDTNLYVVKVWCEVAFNNCHSWILKQAAERQYHLYLLCDADLPWVQDELREYPDPEFRKKLFRMYYDVVVNDGTPWVHISGTYTERLQQAIAAIDSFIFNPVSS